MPPAWLSVPATLALLAGLLALGPAPGASAGDRVKLRESVPAYAGPGAGAEPVPATQRLSFHLVLGLRDPAGARALARRVSDPRSDSYREFVSAPEFRRRFSWRRGEIRPVVRWLRRQGVAVGSPAPNGVLVPAVATAAEFERTFRTRLGLHRAYGQELVAPRSPLRLPRSLSRVVRGTIGVPEAPVSPRSAETATASAAQCPPPSQLSADPGPPWLGCAEVFQQPPPPYCSRFWAAQADAELPPAYGQIPLLAICGYRARQIRSAYGAQKLYRTGVDGSGVDVGIVTGLLSPTLQSDLDDYSDENGIPRTRLRIRKPPSYRPAQPEAIWSLYSEQTLDTQVSHGMAPGARIHYSGPDAIPRVAEQIAADGELVDRNRVEVISNSWGVPEVGVSRTLFRAAEDIFVQAAAQGITVLFSSGDTGDGIAQPPGGFGIRTVWYPASSRWVTAVGGTTLNVGPTGRRVWEQGWGESVTDLDPVTGEWDPNPPGTYAGGSTGGTSRVFRQPGYQRDRVRKALSGYFGGRARVVPDLALIADPMSGAGVVQTAFDPSSGVEVVTEQSVGGTSVAAPVFAGAVALIADRNGGRLGFLNPSLYRVRGKAIRRIGPARRPPVSALALYANSLDSSDGFRYGLLSGGQYGTLTVRRGYDDVTGLGSPSAQILAKRLRRRSG